MKKMTFLLLAVIGGLLYAAPAWPQSCPPPASGRWWSEDESANDYSQCRSCSPRERSASVTPPFYFEANQGQTAPEVRFLARGRGYALFLTPTEAILATGTPVRRRDWRHTDAASAIPDVAPAESIHEIQNSGFVLRMELVGANPRPQVVGLDQLPGKSTYLISNDPTKWRANVPIYAKVKYSGVYPGVDLIYYGNLRQLEYDFVVAPGADPTQIKLSFRGADEIEIDAHGDLVLHTAHGEIRQRKPRIYQEVNGIPQDIAGGYVLLQESASDQGIELTLVGFHVAAYHAARPLVIDPVLVYSTYLGGAGRDFGLSIATDGSGNAYVTGSTLSTNFPTMNALQPALFGGEDIFVTKFDPAGALVYSTYLGGAGADRVGGIAVDAAGNTYVTGRTSSMDFPTVGPLQPDWRGGVSDAFLAKLNPAGSALVYSTYLGGSDFDQANGVAVDAAGNAYVAGNTFSADFPTTDPAPLAAGGFVVKLNSTGSAVVYSTFVGVATVAAVAADAAGNAYVTGEASARFGFPTTPGSFQTAFGGGEDAFVMKLNPTGSVVYSTLLGGNLTDRGEAVAVDANRNAYITGTTSSTDFPTANALQPAPSGVLGDEDAFVAKLDPNGSVLVYSTYLGGSSQDRGMGLAVDPSGNAYVTGFTSSGNFPIANAVQPTLGGISDAFVTLLDPNGSVLIYSTYLGGSADEMGLGIAADAGGNAYVTGFSQSRDFPTANPLQPVLASTEDAFVTKLTLVSADANGLSPPELLNGGKRMLAVSGINFLPGTTVTLSRGRRGEPDPGDVPGTVVFLSSKTLVAEFDLASFDVFGEWDVIIRSPDGRIDIRPILILPSIIYPAIRGTGTLGFPVGLERTNFLEVLNIGNDDGVVLLQVIPPAPGVISLKVGSLTRPIWDSATEPDPTRVNLLVPLNKLQGVLLPTSWRVPPEQVIFPEALISPSTAPPRGQWRELVLAQQQQPVTFGENQTVSWDGIKGATKSRLKGMIKNVLLKTSCQFLGEKLGELEGVEARLLDQAINNVVETLKDATTVEKGLEEVAKFLAEKANPASKVIFVAADIGKCLGEIADGILKGFETASKEAADRIRAATGGDLAQSVARAVEEIAREGGNTLWAFHALTMSGGLFDQLRSAPCSPPVRSSDSYSAPVRGPWDPNDKVTNTLFPCEPTEVGGATRCLRSFISLANATNPIEYVIQFENKAEATAPAQDVVITDVLDGDFAASTLEVISTSHPDSFSMQVTGDTIAFRYRGINLPPNRNPPEGEGYVMFSVRPEPGLLVGTELRNGASIVFDFNPPIATPEVIHVLIPNGDVVPIDIKPGSFPNSINPRSRGVIPVAILTTSTFNATTVNSRTVRFGARGTEAPPVRAAFEDVDRDGDLDLILHFRTENTGLACGASSGLLTGQTFSGQTISAVDSVTTVACK